MATILVDETHLAHVTDLAKHAFLRMFDDYCEDYLPDGWLQDSEHEVWEAGNRGDMPEKVTQQDADLFAIMCVSVVLNGWVIRDDEGDAAVVDMDEWAEMHARYLSERN